MNIYRPQHAVKVRSQLILDAIGGKLASQNGRPMPCTLRIAGLVPGHRCAPQATVVPCHVGNLGKGTSTKVSDLNVAAGCLHCHDIIDRRDKRWEYLADKYPYVIPEAMLRGQQETLALLYALGVIQIPGATEIRSGLRTA